MEKRFTLPVQAQSLMVLVKASRPLASRDFAVCVLNGDGYVPAAYKFYTDLMWSDSLDSFYHYSSPTSELGWVNFRRFKWAFDTNELNIAIKNWKAKDVDEVVEDFRLCLNPEWSIDEKITLQGERI